MKLLLILKDYLKINNLNLETRIPVDASNNQANTIRQP